MCFYEKIKSLRIEKGWTQEELARRIHVSPKTLSSYERGYRALDDHTISLLADLFDLEMQPKDKKGSSHATVWFSDIVKNPELRLDGKYYINKQPVTLRTEIPQGLNRLLEQEADDAGKTVSEILQSILESHYDTNEDKAFQ
ncbi:helix-turn-helix transcriptional regulator (plasmid) [Pontibacillus sp. ALD_SL1]|uniref:helix-turn-helix domain-containing protein n=1 Tax=Pontibacillus sp. ALD_SL1 TaxID=2777185 RepID=UPI001A95A315|nr:helix-turn-helix transcriptional regulator [Pontibacillus sp. ALD_SL1]QST02741.1 helix-turn-helix transcriptional regulator [Pontibacillus sp. ALD_SL1]